jgi:hypothetical protein
VNDTITFHDVGGGSRSTPWSDPPLYHKFRDEHRDRWLVCILCRVMVDDALMNVVDFNGQQDGHFTARFPKSNRVGEVNESSG